jgi:hypothetical protein
MEGRFFLTVINTFPSNAPPPSSISWLKLINSHEISFNYLFWKSTTCTAGDSTRVLCLTAYASPALPLKCS